MDEELVQEYLRRYNKKFSPLKRDDSPSIWLIELTEDSLRKKQQDFADRMLLDESIDPSFFSSGALIFYGYRLGAVRLKGKNECYTRQGGYMDNAIWNYNLDEILDLEIEDENSDVGASHIIEWIINPGSNTDVAEAVISKMIVPMVKNLCRITPPGKRTECTIIMPPISEDIEIQEWSTIFTEANVKNLKINIANYGHLLKLKENQRCYILQHQMSGIREYVVLAAYEVIRGHSTSLGCMAFDVEDSDRQYILHDIKPLTLDIGNLEERYEKKSKEEKAAEWEYLDCLYPINRGFNSFLGSHAASFGREIYKISDIPGDSRYDNSAIRNVFHGNEALQVIDVCSRLLHEDNLYNIALGDLVYIASVLQRDKRFKTVTIGTNKTYKLGTLKPFASSVDVSMLYRIPSNYASITWRIINKRKKLVPYFKLEKNTHSERQIIESIVDHFEHCTTTTIADELLYLYKKGEDPSAFFVAKVFMYLSQMDSLEIESRNEIVTNIENVDDIEYQEIDKLQFEKSLQVGRIQKRKAIEQKRTRLKEAANKRIEDLEFSVRTYSSLKRAGISKVGDLLRKTPSDLIKVRNLGKKGVDEVLQKLDELGLTHISE